MVCEVLIEMLYLLDKTERTSGIGLSSFLFWVWKCDEHFVLSHCSATIKDHSNSNHLQNFIKHKYNYYVFKFKLVDLEKQDDIGTILLF